MSNIEITLKKIFEREDVLQILSSVKYIGLVEYEDIEMPYIKAFANIISELGLSNEIVKEIVYTGSRCITWKKHESNNIRAIFPSAKVRSEHSYDNCSHLQQTLTIHFLNGADSDNFEALKESIQKSNYFYSITIFIKKEFEYNLFDELYLHEGNVDINIYKDLNNIRFLSQDVNKEQTDYCEDRQKFFQGLLDNEHYESAFNQCMSEIPNGCEECYMCNNYGIEKQCPYFQKEIGDFYKDNNFLPSNDVIAHNWYLKAARQGYKPACIKLAEDFAAGSGCKKDLLKFTEILSNFADKGDSDCAARIYEITKDSENPIIAGHYCLMLANSDTEESASWKAKVAHFFEVGDGGFPIDSELQTLWEMKAAENGDPNIIESLANKYKEHCIWEKALYWFNRLKEENNDLELDDIIDELTKNVIRREKLSPRQIAEKGYNLFNGWKCDEDKHAALLYFQIAAESEDSLAYAGLADFYFDTDEEISWNYRNKAADTGDINSLIYIYKSSDQGQKERLELNIINRIEEGFAIKDKYALKAKAKCMQKGIIWGENQEEAFNLYQEVVELYDDPESLYQLGICFLEGIGTDKDVSLGYQYIENAAKYGVLDAQYKIGEYYYSIHNYPNALEWFAKSAKRGFSKSQYKLYLFYKHGIVVPKNVILANEWCLKAANSGFSEAEETIGFNYYEGNEIDKNLSEARNWLSKAVEHGRSSAEFRLAYMCANGEGGPRDYEKAFQLYSACADRGDSAAMNNLGCMFGRGESVSRDLVEAAKWYLKSAEAGDLVGQANIGKKYEQGCGVEKDINKAIYWYEKSIDNGYSYAAYFMARIYRDSEDKDINKAVYYYEKALSMPHETMMGRRGYDPSIIELADLYYYGTEVEKDEDKAFELYKKAAELNILRAFLQLGNCYLYGYGTTKDNSNAIYWLKKAAEKDDNEAKNKLRELNVIS